MKNNNLAIAIPTYNRADILKENILLMLPEVQKFSIPIYVSDDSSNDETQLVMNDLKQIYEFIYYSKNSPSVGHDPNCIRTLSLPSEEYIWYLGDSMLIRPGAIPKILLLISKTDYDFISVSEEHRIINIENKIYNVGNELMMDLCWHLTLTGATIYSKKTIQNIDKIEINRYKNFPQTAIIFENFATKSSQLNWINEKLIIVSKNKKSYWSKGVFDVFLNDWANFIINLPEDYTENIKAFAIKSHSRNTNIFSIKSFLSYRADGILNLKVYKKYSELLKKCCDVNISIII